MTKYAKNVFDLVFARYSSCIDWLQLSQKTRWMQKKPKVKEVLHWLDYIEWSFYPPFIILLIRFSDGESQENWTLSVTVKCSTAILT